MAWPTDRTFTIHDVNSLTYQEILQSQVDLFSKNEEKILKVAFRRGAIEPFRGGDEFKVNVMITGGDVSKEYDPAAENPSTTVGSTGYQVLAPSTYKIFGRVKNVTFSQDLDVLNQGPLKVGDAMAKTYMANFKKMIEELVNDQGTPGGFFNPTAVLPGSGLTNAKAMFADVTSNFAEVVVGTYDKFKPQIVSASSADGANLISTDLTELFTACDWASEGYPTDLFTGRPVWKKIISLKAAKNVATSSPAEVDFGARDTTEHGGVLIHWSRWLENKSTAWDVSAGLTAEYACLAIDMNSVRFRIKQGGTEPGDEYGLITRVGPLFLHPTLLKWSQRVRFLGQWYFSTSRRTSGQLEGLSTV